MSHSLGFPYQMQASTNTVLSYCKQNFLLSKLSPHHHHYHNWQDSPVWANAFL